MREERVAEIRQRVTALNLKDIKGHFVCRDGSKVESYVYVDADATVDFHDHALGDVTFLLAELDRLGTLYNQIRKDCPKCGRLIADHKGTECL